MVKDRDVDTAIGCTVVGLWLVFSLAWVAFIVWAVYSVVSWLVTK